MTTGSDAHKFVKFISIGERVYCLGNANNGPDPCDGLIKAPAEKKTSGSPPCLLNEKAAVKYLITSSA